MAAQPVLEHTGRQRLTVEEWRVLERESHNVKHEYIDGTVYAMAGGSQAHSGIAVNLIATLHTALGDGPCRVYNSDVATRVSTSRSTYADAAVVCSEEGSVARREETEIDSPRVIFEVLSDSTERIDRGRKWDDYRGCPSMEEYVLVGTAYQRVEVYRRTAEGWGMFHIHGPSDEVELLSINVRFKVAALYRRTDVPQTAPE